MVPRPPSTFISPGHGIPVEFVPYCSALVVSQVGVMVHDIAACKDAGVRCGACHPLTAAPPPSPVIVRPSSIPLPCGIDSCSGVVIGGLNPDGTVDESVLRRLIDAARPMRYDQHSCAAERLVELVHFLSKVLLLFFSECDGCYYHRCWCRPCIACMLPSSSSRSSGDVLVPAITPSRRQRDISQSNRCTPWAPLPLACIVREQCFVCLG